MAEKQHFVQIVDNETGKVDRVANLNEIKAMSPEEQLELSRHKQLFIVSHKIEPIVKVTLKRTVITAPIEFGETEAKEADKKKEGPKPATAPKSKGRKKS